MFKRHMKDQIQHSESISIWTNPVFVINILSGRGLRQMFFVSRSTQLHFYRLKTNLDSTFDKAVRSLLSTHTHTNITRMKRRKLITCVGGIHEENRSMSLFGWVRRVLQSTFWFHIHAHKPIDSAFSASRSNWCFKKKKTNEQFCKNKPEARKRHRWFIFRSQEDTLKLLVTERACYREQCTGGEDHLTIKKKSTEKKPEKILLPNTG